MNKKKAVQIMVIKFIISTVIALLLFYFLMYRSCAFMPLIHDRAGSVISDFEEKMDELKSGDRLKRIPLPLTDKKAFFFFEKDSQSIEMYRSLMKINRVETTLSVFIPDRVDFSNENRFILHRPLSYCNKSTPCFCYCDDLRIKTSTENCYIELECRRGKIACSNMNEKFFFQQDKEGFFNDTTTKTSINLRGYHEYASTRLVFKGGFLISPKHNVIATYVDRTNLVIMKNQDEFHLCSRVGDCITNDRSSIIQPLIDKGCTTS